jgi:cell division cycle 20-like protein 1 (cofactor of APC complex)
MKQSTQRMMLSAQNKQKQKQSEMSVSSLLVLDASSVLDDFYSSVLDWHPQHSVIGVALSDSLYLYNTESGGVSECSHQKQPITAVRFNASNHRIAAFASAPTIKIWDICTNQQVSSLPGPSTKHIGALEWIKDSANVLLSGSKLSRTIFMSDVRENSRLRASHKINTSTQVVSLCASPSGTLFAIGGRDRCVSVYDVRYFAARVFKLQFHTSSIRALAWSPHNSSVLCSGGGATDKKLCFWNLSAVGNSFQHRQHRFNYIQHRCITVTEPTKCIRTDSQVCNVVFDQITKNQVLSTHGFDSNHITLWNTKNKQIIRRFQGHQQRVLFLASSPNKTHVCTASSDETLQFWNAFGAQSKNHRTDESETDNHYVIR